MWDAGMNHRRLWPRAAGGCAARQLLPASRALRTAEGGAPPCAHSQPLEYVSMHPGTRYASVLLVLTGDSVVWGTGVAIAARRPKRTMA